MIFVSEGKLLSLSPVEPTCAFFPSLIFYPPPVERDALRRTGPLFVCTKRKIFASDDLALLPPPSSPS